MLWKFLRQVFRANLGADARVSRGLMLRKAGRLRDAERVLRDAIASFPHDAVAATNLAIVLLEQDRAPDGIAMLQRALASDPQCAAAHYNFATVLRGSGRLEEAIEHYGAAEASVPRVASAGEELMHTLLEVCAWDRAQVESDKLRALVAARDPDWMRFISPLTCAYLELDPVTCKDVARHHASECAGGVQPIRRRNLSLEESPRIRIAYLSRDFRDHPVGHLMRNVLALHDRNRFEVFAYSFGPNDGSVYRDAIAGGADHFVEVGNQSDEHLAHEIAAAGVHVLIDLMGHTTGNRLSVLARRPAPVQSHYLGFPGTTGAPYIDYFITDAIATPPQLAPEFTEQLAYVPRCFMVGNGVDAQTWETVTRADQGLPPEAFVFCNFANSSRITRDVFALWMEILRAVPSGVLWLKHSHPLTVNNLRRETQRYGIAAERLIFAPRVAGKPAHLARVRVANLALDTIGWYNGHSSTSDMLWAGVPVLTAPGQTFAGRVASSLCNAAGLSELVADDAQDYVRRAVQLGNERAQCAALTQKLVSNRGSAVFFNERAIVADLEDAYAQMWELYCAGAPARRIG